MPRKKFLIVDDDRGFINLVASTLKPHAECHLASNGEEAIRNFQHHAWEGKPFDAIFMDIEMPGMDGHQTAQKMRELEKEMGTDPLSEFKLVMLTSHTDVKNVTVSFFQDQADVYVPKGQFLEKLLLELKKTNIIS